jgi:hypothetical protein
MSPIMQAILYLGLGLTLVLLRLERGQSLSEAIMAGLLWPLEMLIAGVEAVVQSAMPTVSAEQ